MKRIGIGLVLIVLALALLFQGYVVSWHVSIWLVGWCLVFGLLCVQSLLRKRWLGALSWLGLGAIVVNHSYRFVNLSTFLLLVVWLLLMTGLKFVFSGKKQKRRTLVSIVEDDNLEVNFGSSDKYINEPFDDLSAEANFGTLNLYFSDMEVQGQKMHLDVDVNFATMRIYVPQNWQVKLDVTNAFSSVNGLKQVSGGVTILQVTGNVDFSTLKIEYV